MNGVCVRNPWEVYKPVSDMGNQLVHRWDYHKCIQNYCTSQQIKTREHLMFDMQLLTLLM